MDPDDDVSPPRAFSALGALGALGADEAIIALHAEHAERLVRLGVLLLGDQAAAEDVVQDAYVALHARWDRLAERERAVAYLRRSVVNAARNVQARRRTVDRFLARAAEPHPTPPADASVLAEETRTRVVAALGRLPRRQREVLVLRHYLDLSEREIADALGISAGSVKTHASRGAATLRTLLEETR